MEVETKIWESLTNEKYAGQNTILEQVEILQATNKFMII